ncbi:MAG: hypothetical protein ACUVX8_15510, partial [Candidatus Zipacnadales bacterium]
PSCLLPHRIPTDRFRIGSKIAEACDFLLQRVAEKVMDGLGLTGGKTPLEVAACLRQWYENLPQATRQYCHTSDAGTLQQCLAKHDNDSLLAALAHELTGHPLDEWADTEVERFVGRLQGGKTALETWKPPDDPRIPTGMARLTVEENVGEEIPRVVRRDFRLIAREQWSESALMVLYLCTANLMDNPTFCDGERENIVLELVRRVFGNG